MKQAIIRNCPEVDVCGFINSEACATVRVLETGDEAGAHPQRASVTTATPIAQKAGRTPHSLVRGVG